MRDLVGKRMLLLVRQNQSSFGTPPVEEFKILEVSPSGNFVRLQNTYGNKFWRATAQVAVVEALTPLEKWQKTEESP